MTDDSVRVSRRAAAQRGQAALFVTLSIPVLFGLLGLTVEVGWAYWRKEAAHTAAQSAVAAIVSAAGTTTPATQSDTACPSSPDTSSAWQVGCLFASQNGFTNGSNGQTVSVQIGSGSSGIPVSGVASTNYWVSVTVSETQKPLFSAVIGGKGLTVRARSTGAAYKGSTGGCVYAMAPSATQALKVTGGDTGAACGFYVESTGIEPFYLTGGDINLGTGGSKINMTAPQTDETTWPPTGGNVYCGGTTDCLNTNVVWNSGSFTNPISGLPTPSAGTCIADPNITTGTYTLSPGTYCNGITIKGGNVTLGAGLYYFTGGDLSISGGTTLVDATAGATLYFAPNAGRLKVTNNGLNLNAPSGGSWDGIAIYKNSSSVPDSTWDWTGGTVNINGVIDIPNSPVKYKGGGTAVTSTIVCYTFATTGGSITGPAASKYFTGTGSTGGSNGGAYIVE